MIFEVRTLGCKVNTYESNVIIDLLENAGFKRKKDSEQVDVYIVNTCTVTNTADNKSLKLIRQLHRENENALIVVCGCSHRRTSLNY